MGYGAGVVNPYLAFETIDDMVQQGLLTGTTRDEAVARYIKALNKGILKVMSKMGISTLASYCGAQIFEAIGLSQEFIDKYFTHTTSRIGGVGIDVIAEEVRLRHERAYGRRPAGVAELDAGGEYQWRRDGEYHLFNPDTVFKLQHATRSGQYRLFKDYTRAVNDQHERRATLRGLFRLKPAGPAVPIEDVEPVESIVRRFATGAMSYGSIRHEPAGRQVEHRRRRGIAGAVHPAGQRRLEAKRDQAGRLRQVRRDERVPGERRRAADQDGAGRQAG
jgi:glutamate synthase domain-containing protein 2